MISLDRSARDPARLAHLSLPAFLERLTTDDGKGWYYDEEEAGRQGEGETRRQGEGETDPPPTPRNSPPATPNYVLIIDQFEEIVTTHGACWPERAEFFRQLEAAIVADPALWVVLTLREDFVASLDPYAPLLSDKLRARYYMQRMGLEAAKEAIRKPAEERHRQFQPQAVDLLVNNLSQVRVAGKSTTERGQTVEPVQLQVVCYQLWERLAGENKPGFCGETRFVAAQPITVTDVQQAGDVDSALASFYEATLAAALHSHPLPGGERALRRWFEEHLITEAGTRGTVYRGESETGSLPNALVLELANRFLLRSESRAGGRWVELTHDRFVEPIQAANRAWEAKQNNPLAAVTQLWLDNSRDPARLLKGQQLVDAQSYAAAHTETLTPLERDFLTVSVQREQADIAAAIEAATRRRTLLAVGLVALILFALLAFYGQNRASEANRQKATAQSQATDAAIAKATAVAESTRSAIAVVTAEAALDQAERQSQIARSRQLAAQALSELNNGRYEPAILLAIESGRITDTLEAFAAIRTAIANPWHSRVLLQGHTGSVYQATWSQDESKILTRSADGTARIWDARVPDGRGKELVKLEGHTSSVSQATWSQDESKILTRSYDNTARIWDAATGKELVKLEGHTSSVSQATWSQDESKILTRSDDGTARIWYVHIKDLIDAACRWTPRNMSTNEWSLYMEGPYRPTCPTVILPLDVIDRIYAESRALIQQGKFISATSQIDQLNGWLKENGQWQSMGITPTLFIVEQAAELARSGEITQAVASYQEALRLDPTLSITPVVEARRNYLLGVNAHAVQLARSGEITASLAAISRALQLDPAVEITGNTWNEICWNGALTGLAVQVLDACNKAVAATPDNGGIHDSRGLVRALIGDTKGAISDFEFFISWAKETGNGRNVDWRERYVTDLKAGKNPFTPAELEKLRNE